MRAGLAVCRARVLALLQYRAAALAGIATQVFFGLVHVTVLRAFFRGSGAQPMAAGEAVAYVWLGQAFFAMLPWRLDGELQRQFLRGEVAYELLRPVDLYGYWFARHVAFLAAPMLLRCVPILVLAGALGDLPPPASAAGALAFGLSMGASLALSAAMITTVTLTFFWTVSGEGTATFHGAAFFLFSGMLLPLPLFPDWTRPLLEALPYRGVIDLPFRLYLGHLPPAALGGVLAHQLMWTLILVLGGRALLRVGTRQLVVQGG